MTSCREAYCAVVQVSILDKQPGAEDRTLAVPVKTRELPLTDCFQTKFLKSFGGLPTRASTQRSLPQERARHSKQLT